jgi:hypothetical protein
VAEVTLRVQLFFMATLALFVRCQKSVCSEFACRRHRMAVGTGNARIPDVKAMREFDGARLLLQLTHLT